MHRDAAWQAGWGLPPSGSHAPTSPCFRAARPGSSASALRGTHLGHVLEELGLGAGPLVRHVLRYGKRGGRQQRRRGPAVASSPAAHA